MGEIARIAKADVHRITSGQVVLDVQTAVKELVENALDAGATSIEVRFKEHGSESIEVIDNGSGIAPSNYMSLALKHYTSKLTTFDDLTNVETYGFRGEALSSLCALAEVQMHTATAAEAPMGTILDFDQAGHVKARDKKVARQRGTTVTVENLFHSLPVRRRELLKNIKREYTKAQTLLQAYAVITKGVRWMVSNSIKGRKTPALTVSASSGSNYVAANVGAVFGPKAMASLIPLKLEVPLSGSALRRGRQGPEEVEEDHAEDMVLVRGLISRPTPGSGRSSSDRIFLYINGRPWDSTKLTRSFTEVYRSFNTNQAPVVIADLTLARDRYDVNVSPDKRTMLIHNEADLVEGLKTCLEESFAPSRATFTLAGATSSATKATAAQSQLPFKRQQIEGQTSSESDDNGSEEAVKVTSAQAVRRREADSDEDENDEVFPRPSKHRRRDDHGMLFAATSSPKTSSLRPTFEPAVEPEEDVIMHDQEEEAAQRSAHGYIDAVIDTTSASWSPEKKRTSTQGALSSSDRTANGSQSSPSASRILGRGTSSSNRELSKPVGPLRDYALSGTPLKTQEVIALDEEEGVSEIATSDLEYREDGIELFEPTSAELSQRQEEQEEQEEADFERESGSDDHIVDEKTGRDRRRQHQDSHNSEGSNSLGEEGEGEANREETLVMLDEEGAAIERNETGAAERAWKDEILSVNEAGEVVMPVDMERISLQCARMLSKQSASALQGQDKAHEANEEASGEAGIHQRDTERAERELSRVLSKADFAQMQVIGQFNLGFIVARRTKRGTDDEDADDLFIVDQHAADEKYNFETLQVESKIPTQPLLRPKTLELSLVDEMVAMEHVDTIKSKGFGLQVDAEAPAGSRIKVVSQPLKLNDKDLEELLFLLREAVPGGPLAMRAQCSKVRSIFASRACRKSVMIGMALNKRQMTTVLRHMGTIDQPWNCPHGRPTLRHLCQVAPMGPSKNRSISWSRI